MTDTSASQPENQTTAEESANVSVDDQFQPDLASVLGEPDLREEVLRLETDVKAANDRVLRVQAELENYRKRARRELEDEKRYATLPLMRDLLNVVDNLERAIGSAEQSDNPAGLLAGVKMVAVQLHNVLEQYGCRRLDAHGAPFDPHVHEAIAQEPSDEHPPSTVTRVTQAGYQLHDRVVRPAQVFVSTGPARPAEESNSPDPTN
jgi:molecular chaperone GrpE